MKWDCLSRKPTDLETRGNIFSSDRQGNIQIFPKTMFH